jgi:hypothetical protein
MNTKQYTVLTAQDRRQLDLAIEKFETRIENPPTIVEKNIWSTAFPMQAKATQIPGFEMQQVQVQINFLYVVDIIYTAEKIDNPTNILQKIN